MSDHSSGSVSAHSLIRCSSPAAAVGLAAPPDPKLAAGLNCTVLCTSLGPVAAVTRLLHSNTQIVLWAAAYAGILQNQNLARQVSRGRGESRRSILRAGLDLSCMYLAHHELGSVVIIAVIDILELPQTSGQ